MPRTKKKKTAPPKKKAKKAAPKAKKREPPVAMIVRRNAAPRATPAQTQALATTDDTDEARLERMGGWHVMSGAGGALAGQTLSVITVGQGWLGPKLTHGLVLGAGLAISAAGYYWEVDHLMSGGIGVATAGALGLTNQVAVDSYLRIEERAAQKRREQQAQDEEKARLEQLTAARALLEGEAELKKQRNARRVVVLDHTGEPIEDDEAERAAA